MAFLANHLAAQRESSVITDDLLFQPLIPKIQGPEHGDPAFDFATAIIECAVPEPLQEIPIRKIVSFRKHHDAERRRFYAEVNRLVNDLHTVKEKEAREDILNHRHQDVTAAASDLRKSFAGVRISTATGLLSASTPAVVAGTAAGPGGVMAILGAKTYSAITDYRKVKAGSPYTYVLSLKKLKSSTLLEDLLKARLIL